MGAALDADLPELAAAVLEASRAVSVEVAVVPVGVLALVVFVLVVLVVLVALVLIVVRGVGGSASLLDVALAGLLFDKLVVELLRFRVGAFIFDGGRARGADLSVARENLGAVDPDLPELVRRAIDERCCGCRVSRRS